MAKFNFTKSEEVNWTHYSVSPDGQITVYFEGHNHETIDMDDLKSLTEASLTSVTGEAVKKVAEKIKTGSSTGITEKAIRDKFQADNNARMESLKEAVSE